MKKYWNKLLFLLCISITMTSCFEDPGTEILTQENSVELDEAATATKTTSKGPYTRINDGLPVNDNLKVILNGPQRSTPINVTYRLVTGTGNGVKGTHFNITDGTVTIPANASSVNIPFQVLDDNIVAGTFYTFVVELVSADIPVSTNYARGTIRFTTSCTFGFNSLLGAYSCVEPGYPQSPYDVGFTLKDACSNTITNSNFWDAGYKIDYVLALNGTVSIPTQTVSGAAVGLAENLIIAGSGTYNTTTSSMVVDYTVKGATSGTTWDSNTHTFTKKP
jgi:hypothetical protein